MKKSFFQKVILNLFAFVVLISPFLVLDNAKALSTDDVWGGDGKSGEVSSATGLGDTVSDPRIIAANVIKAILGFLGIFALVLILMGGFRYMNAKGDSKETDAAIGIIRTAAIGLIIILGAYGLATFIFEQILNNVINPSL